MGLKVMPRSYKGHKFIIVAIDKVTNFIVFIPIHHPRLEEIGDALIEHVFSKYSTPEYMTINQDSAFMSTVINYLFMKMGTKIKIVRSYNHQCLQTEHGIRSSVTLLTPHLRGLSQ